MAIAWIGFDKPRPLGKGETGAGAALPIWIKYMATALQSLPEVNMWMPEGVDAIYVDPTTGVRDDRGVVEYFYHENPPAQLDAGVNAPSDNSLGLDGAAATANQVQQLLQPEPTSPAAPNKANASSPGNAAAHATPDPQNAAAKILKIN